MQVLNLSSIYEKNHDSIGKTLQIAWPSVMEAFLVALVGFVDTLMVSSLGTSAVASVGLTMNPKFVALVMFMSLNMGVSALSARRKGEGDRDGVHIILLWNLILTAILGFIISIIGVVFSNQILTLAGSQKDTHKDAVMYFQIIIGCILFHALSMAINAVQRGIGNAIIAMKTNIVSNLINLAGSYLLIQGRIGFPMLGVQGAAIASVLGTVVALGMSILSIFNKNSYLNISYLIRYKLRVKWNSISSILRMSLPILMEQICMRVGFLLVAFMVARLGTDAFAVNQVAMNVMGLTFSFGDGLSIAAVALIGESLGKGESNNAKLYIKICMYLAVAITIILAAVYFVGGRGIYMLFFQEETLIQSGVGIMHMMILIVPLQIMQLVCMGSLRGAGDTIYTTIVSMISVLIIRPLFGYIFCYTLGIGLLGVWIGVLFDQIVRVTFTILRLRTDKWTKLDI